MVCGSAAGRALEEERESLVSSRIAATGRFGERHCDLLRVSGLPQTAAATAAVARAERLSADRTVSGARRADAIRLLGIAGAASREASLLVFVDPRRARGRADRRDRIAPID